MAMDALSIWKAQWDLLPLDGTGSAYPMNLANVIGDRVDGKMTTLSVTSSASFTFNRALFAAEITGMAPQVTAIAGATKISDAWKTAILASTLTVPPGAFVGAAAPPTTFSVVSTVVVSPAAGYASLIAGLIAAPLAGGLGQSVFPEELRKAFELLTYTITGLDSTPPPAGPLPLVAVSTVQ